MPSEAEDVVAVRWELLDLLRQQVEALNSPLGLTDGQLRECYDRQSRVQELREKLQASSNPQRDRCSPLSELSTMATARSSADVSSTDVSMASLDTAA
jgi:hypothetical protein